MYHGPLTSGGIKKPLTKRGKDGTVHVDRKRLNPYIQMQRLLTRCSGAPRREDGHSPGSSLPLHEDDIGAVMLMLRRFGVDEKAVFANEWREDLMEVSGMTPLGRATQVPERWTGRPEPP